MPLLKEFLELGCPTDVGPAWPLTTILAAIATGPHASTLTPEAVAFCQQELLERAQRGFSIILLVDVALLVFGDRIRVSCLVSVDQANIRPCLVCDSSAAPDDVTPAVNVSTDKSTAPGAMQFGACLPWFLQKIWEADPFDGPVWLYKWDISDTFHQCLLHLGDIGTFAYVVPSLPTDIYILLCIDLVLPLFCASSETVADVANGYMLDPTSAFTIYPPTAGTYSLAPSPTASAARIQCVDIYMDDLNCATQGDVGQQQQAYKLTIRALK